MEIEGTGSHQITTACTYYLTILTIYQLLICIDMVVPFHRKREVKYFFLYTNRFISLSTVISIKIKQRKLCITPVVCDLTSSYFCGYMYV